MDRKPEISERFDINESVSIFCLRLIPTVLLLKHFPPLLHCIASILQDRPAA